MIEVQKLVSNHNPILMEIDYESPLTVGNGEFAYTADITGMQTLTKDYSKRNFPLCTMSQWGWHSEPFDENTQEVTLADLEMTEYSHNGKKVSYAVNEKKGNEKEYNWLRENPHKFNLGNIGLLWNEAPVEATDISMIKQELKLYEGKIISEFTIQGVYCKVITFVSQTEDSVNFYIESEALRDGTLKVGMTFPYGASNISGSDWFSDEKHHTTIENKETGFLVKRKLDDTTYTANISSNKDILYKKVKDHDLVFSPESSQQLSFSVLFTEDDTQEPNSYEENYESLEQWWPSFWDEGGIIKLSDSEDTRANELERRIILSKYLIAIQGTGSLPPQETGLTVNSWYGKFHLEMHFWHIAFLILWGHNDLVLPSINWYKEHLPEAKGNAEKNNYTGARWPKMIAFDAKDSPSEIATLLIWQQSHIIYLLELLYKTSNDEELLNEYWEVVESTADFMCDFLVYDENTNTYKLTAPIMPSQEVFDPETVENPMFELEYWRFTLGLAIKWANRKNIDKSDWIDVYNNFDEPPMKDSVYLSHRNAEDTYEKYNTDHPSVLGSFGLIPNDRISLTAMENTYEKVMETWEFNTMWGWDFAMMAMTLERLGKFTEAMDILLLDTPKNYYSKSGNNMQKTRDDLPLYLPGNGSLLLAITLIVAGFGKDGNEKKGSISHGKWKIQYQNISPFPY